RTHTSNTKIYTLSLHDALPIYIQIEGEKTWEDSSNQDGKRPNSITVILNKTVGENGEAQKVTDKQVTPDKNGEWKYIFENLPKRSEEHTSELQSRFDLVCRLLL